MFSSQFGNKIESKKAAFTFDVVEPKPVIRKFHKERALFNHFFTFQPILPQNQVLSQKMIRKRYGGRLRIPKSKEAKPDENQEPQTTYLTKNLLISLRKMSRKGFIASASILKSSHSITIETCPKFPKKQKSPFLSQLNPQKWHSIQRKSNQKIPIVYEILSKRKFISSWPGCKGEKMPESLKYSFLQGENFSQ